MATARITGGRRANVRRTRVVTGCQACRVRHVRCDNKITACAACVRDGIECVRAPNIRFRHRTGEGNAFPKAQVWVPVEGRLRYRDETARVAKWYEDPESSDEASWLANSPAAGPSAEEASLTVPQPTPPQEARLSDWNNALTVKTDDSYVFSLPAEAHYAEPAILTDREATLMRNYVENMALWADVTDIGRHFETDVPRRALYEPILRYAIFAFSSHHVNRFNVNSQENNSEALEYYNRCLNLLIPRMSQASTPPERMMVTEEIHAAVAVLRQYEEMDAEDRQFHLTGTRRIVNSMSDLDYTPGLREASAWLCLRQDIYISMVNQTPLKTELSAFEKSDTLLWRTDDFAYAAGMVLLLARVMTCAFAKPSADKLESLKKLKGEVDEWYDKKPSSFKPIRHIPRDLSAGRALPELWLLLPCHVVGLQYYHIAQVVLLLIIPVEQSSGYGDLRRGSRQEATVRHHLRYIVALARSNTKAENVLFSARHAISVWGGILRHDADQEAVESFLRHMQDTTGWNTGPLISSLRVQWNED